MLRSVANLTRQDAIDFLELAKKSHLHAQTTVYPLYRANEALKDLRDGSLKGAAVLQVEGTEGTSGTAGT